MIIADRHAVFSFMAPRIGLTWSTDFRGMMHVPDKFRGSLTSRDHVAAAFGFNNFVGRTACVHVVVQDPTKLTRGFMNEVFEHAYNVCGLVALFVTIDSTNTKSMEFATRSGAWEMLRVPEGGLDGDLVVYKMTKAGCRFLKENEHGKRLARTA